jgi:hypothetical protein
MPKKQEASRSIALSKKSFPGSPFVHPSAALPAEVTEFLLQLLSGCNRRISFQLSTFPNAHEESLDLMFISHFASMQGAIKFGSHWTLRIDAHYIGGGRHYRTWEVADIGLMAMYRKNGTLIGSKLAFLQSKKLYASPLKLKEYDPYFRMGMGRLLVTENEHRELVETRVLKYSERSKYKALKLQGEQQNAMKAFSDLHRVPVHYLFYNPSVIPWEICTPVELLPDVPENKVGCRVVPKTLIDQILAGRPGTYSPCYKDVQGKFSKQFSENESEAGWRIEHFICDLFLRGNEGLLDDSPNFQLMTNILSQKSSPISSALSITFDYKE